MIRIKIGQLRQIIQEALMSEAGQAAGASGTDPTKEPKVPYGEHPEERGVDIYSKWYRSPGGSPGADGDPARPADAADYIGQKPKPVPPAGPSQDALEYIGMKPKTAPETQTSEEPSGEDSSNTEEPSTTQKMPVPDENKNKKSEPGR